MSETVIVKTLQCSRCGAQLVAWVGSQVLHAMNLHVPGCPLDGSQP